MLCSSVSTPPGGKEALLVCLCIQPSQIITFTVKVEHYANATVQGPLWTFVCFCYKIIAL